MFKGFLMLFAALAQLLKYPLIIFGALILLLGFSTFCYCVKFRKQLKARAPSGSIPLPKRALWKKVFLDAPRQFVLDRANRPADFFPVHGLVIFEGRQGSGKTSSLVHYLTELQKQYPKLKVITNFGFTSEDAALTDWHQLIDYKNGYPGVAVGMDELQNWFSSKQSANFPPEMLSVVTQNRKNRRVILGTAQNFYMLAKDIRTQCTEVRRCITLAGVFTIVHRVRPITNSEGAVEKYEHIGFYSWVHSPEERDSYDTYKAIENLSASGFKDKPKETVVSVLPVLTGKTK